MSSPEYAMLERIADASPSKIYLTHRAKREIPLRKVILASRLLDLAQREAEEIRVREAAELESEAEHILLMREEATNESDWWYDGEDDDNNTDPETPSALLDTSTLLDFESSLLFTQNQQQPNETDTAIDTTSTDDWSWLRDPKLLGYDGMLPYDSESTAVENYEIANLLSEFSESDEDGEEDVEEGNVVVFVVTDKQEETTNNTAILIGKENITIVPPTAVVMNNCNSNNCKKRTRQQQVEDEQDDELPCNKRRILIRT